LGNVEHVLPQGLVCDACNNYFGRKLEHAVLTSGYFKNLRARQALLSRAGNPLFTEALVTTGGAMFRAEFSPIGNVIDIQPSGVDGRTTIDEAFGRRTGGSVWIPRWGQEPTPPVLSRFLAKIGLEILARRAYGTDQFEAVIFNQEVDPIRNWARRGIGAPQWPVHRRRIYDEDNRFHDAQAPDGYQVVHEFDLLITDANEWYAVICIFGEEFVINLGGPDIEGYQTWLAQHDGASPLYLNNNTPR
jgi:hypothetical protein